VTALIDDLPIGDLLPKILESCRRVLPISSGRDVAPDEAITVGVSLNCTTFPEEAHFGQITFDCFEVDKVSLIPRSESRVPVVLQSRARGDRTDLESVDELLRRIVVPAAVDLALTVRNVSSVPQRFMFGIASHISVLELRKGFLRDGPGEWREDYQRLIDLSEEEARRIDVTLARCADGSPRQDLRLA
jgi:hypothetical protein